MSDELCGRLVRKRDTGYLRPCALKPAHAGRCLDESALERKYRNKRDARAALGPEAIEARRAAERADYAERRDIRLPQMRRSSRARRAVWLAEINPYKLAKGCERCRYAEHPVALEFDHIDRSTKVADVGALISRLTPNNPEHRETVWAEIAKCRVLCSNCHRIKTFEDGENTPRPCATDQASVL